MASDRHDRLRLVPDRGGADGPDRADDHRQADAEAAEEELLDQVDDEVRGVLHVRPRGTSYKLQVTSYKLQVTSYKCVPAAGRS